MVAAKTRKRSASGYDFVVAVPSQLRAETCRDKTLATLARYKIPAALITVFVANAEQKKLQEETLKPNTQGKIVVGIKGLAEVRNFITNYYPKGTKIVSMDDDVMGFVEQTTTTKRHERPLRSLLNTIQRGFAECAKHGAHLWGVYSVPNGFFMKPTVSTDLKHIVGSFWGVINTKDVKITLASKEDQERTILQQERDGAVVRLNFVAPKTAQYKEPGGLSDPNRAAKAEKEVQQLLKKWPEQVTRNPTRKSDYPEIRIKDKGVGKESKTIKEA